MDQQELEDKLNAFYQTYPKINADFDYYKRQWESTSQLLTIYRNELHDIANNMYQYKKKIQRIEEFLIDNGLIRLLGKINAGENQ